PPSLVSHSGGGGHDRDALLLDHGDRYPRLCPDRWSALGGRCLSLLHGLPASPSASGAPNHPARLGFGDAAGADAGRGVAIIGGVRGGYRRAGLSCSALA